MSAMGAAMAMMPSVISAAPAAKKANTTKSNDMINFGFIGLGQQTMGLTNGFIGRKGVRVVAGCDVYDIKRDRFKKFVTDYYTKKGEKKVTVDMYEDYQDLLAREDIDAVVIATPDHQHAVIAIAALKAGKDVYIEKPLTFTIYEGQQLVKAVRKYNRILQVGSHQRSSHEFIHATAVVREGMLGKIHRIKSYVGRFQGANSGSPVPMTLPKMEVPSGLNWDKWLGPLSTDVYYNEVLNPIISEGKGEGYWAQWRYFEGRGGGLMTDWGAHVFDVAQWALGKDGNGPVEVIPASKSEYDCLTFKYDNGVIMTENAFDKEGHLGVKIYGENGWISVARGYYACSDHSFAEGCIEIPKLDHLQQFIDAIRTRVDPNVPVETGHSSCTVCNIANIANKLDRAVKWNPIVQKFMNDPEATALMHYKYRDGYSLDI